MRCCRELVEFLFFFSSRRRHTRSDRDWSSDVCSSDLSLQPALVPQYLDPISEVPKLVGASGRKIEGRPVAGKNLALAFRSGTPEADGPVHACRHQRFPVRGEIDGPNPPEMSSKSCHFFSGLEVPQFGGVIQAGRSEPLPVGGYCQVVNRRLMSAQGPQRASCGAIPKHDGPMLVSRGQDFALRRKSYRAHEAAVAG